MPVESMTFNRLIFSIAVVTLVALALYLLIAFYGLQDPSWSEAPPPPDATIVTSESEPSPAPTIELAAPVAEITQESVPLSGSRLVEIFGRVTDQNRQPLEDVLITEERYFFTTRSDADGNYKLLLDLPRHRYPTLNFLRNGFAGNRIKLTREQLQQKSFYELDVKLAADPDSVTQSGWIGNEHGAPLAGARVDLTALEPGEGNDYYLTVFSEPGGDFVLEGVPAGQKYILSVNLSDEYTIYQDPAFLVSDAPQPLRIKLKLLKLVDFDGMILNREGAPVPNFKIYVHNLTTETHKRTIVSDSSGFFSLRNFPPGEISLSTRGPELLKITGLTLTDSEYRNLVITVDKGNRYLSGWISSADGGLPKQAMVTLDKTYNEGSIRYHQYRSQATDSVGRFSFEGLGGGEYRVTIFAQGYPKTELLHQLRNQADEIHILLKH